MATSLRRKKHQDERACEDSDFLCTCFQMCTKHLETVSTLRNRFMFLQMVDKKDSYSLSETEANWTRNSLFFSNQFPVQEFSSIFHIQSSLHDQAITMNQGTICFDWNTDNYKVWNKFWVVGNLLRWTPLVVFQKYSLPFFDQILFKRYLQPVIWWLTALWGQKNKKR